MYSEICTPNQLVAISLTFYPQYDYITIPVLHFVPFGPLDSRKTSLFYVLAPSVLWTVQT